LALSISCFRRGIIPRGLLEATRRQLWRFTCRVRLQITGGMIRGGQPLFVADWLTYPFWDELSKLSWSAFKVEVIVEGIQK
jgi:hypothetical protein